jgi:hypothetical protein
MKYGETTTQVHEFLKGGVIHEKIGFKMKLCHEADRQ